MANNNFVYYSALAVFATFSTLLKKKTVLLFSKLLARQSRFVPSPTPQDRIDITTLRVTFMVELRKFVYHNWAWLTMCQNTGFMSACVNRCVSDRMKIVMADLLCADTSLTQFEFEVLLMLFYVNFNNRDDTDFERRLKDLFYSSRNQLLFIVNSNVFHMCLSQFNE